MVELAGRVLGGRNACRLLAVEHPQRILLETTTVFGTQRRSARIEVFEEEGAVGRPALAVPERVELEGEAAEPEVGEERPRQLDHLDVGVRVLGADDLGAELMELTVATG